MEEKISSNYNKPFFEWGRIYDEKYNLQELDKEKVKNYINNKPLKKGDEIIIYNGQAGLNEYILAEVVEPHYGKNGHKVQLSKEGSSACYNYSRGDIFHRTGTNVSAPKGKSYMLPPIEGMMDILREKGRLMLC